MRKRLVLLLAGVMALTMAYGVIGSGASFSWAGSARQTIAVGDFGCALSSTTGTVSNDGKSVTLTSPTITSSAAGSAPFDFTVTATKSIPVKVHITQTALNAPFSGMLASPIADVNIAMNEAHTYNAGIQWAELSSADLNKAVGITYAVSCVEQGTTFTSTVFPSTNDLNRAGGGGSAAPGGYVDAVAGNGTVTLTFHKTSLNTKYTCFEYRYNGNTPDQRITENGGVNFNPGIHDGLWPYTCLNVAGSTDTVTLQGSYAETRLSFGAETDERFDWTRFDALP